MLFDQFKRLSSEAWTRYLRWISDSQTAGKVDPKNVLLLYPNILVCTETPHHYIMELVGVDKGFEKLSVKSHKIDSSEKYFNQFENPDISGQASLNLNGKSYINFHGLIFSNVTVSDEKNSRLAFIDRQKYASFESGRGGSIAISKEVNYINFHDCVFINTYSSAIRIKYILQLILIRKDETTVKYRKYLDSIFLEKDHIYGILHCEQGQEINYFTVGQFQNLYLFPGLRETSIGEFIRLHPAFLKCALNTNNFIRPLAKVSKLAKGF